MVSRVGWLMRGFLSAHHFIPGEYKETLPEVGREWGGGGGGGRIGWADVWIDENVVLMAVELSELVGV